MPSKIIRLPQLQRFKQKADAKYQDKLTAGSGITISGNTISASTTGYVAAKASGSSSVDSDTLTSVGTVTLQPGTYIVQYTCQFALNNSGGYRQCGFSPDNTNLDGLGRNSGWDSRAVASGIITQTEVITPVVVSATDYPNGRKFYLLAKQDSGSSLRVYPRCYYLKF